MSFRSLQETPALSSNVFKFLRWCVSKAKIMPKVVRSSFEYYVPLEIKKATLKMK